MSGHTAFFDPLNFADEHFNNPSGSAHAQRDLTNVRDAHTEVTSHSRVETSVRVGPSKKLPGSVNLTCHFLSLHNPEGYNPTGYTSQEEFVPFGAKLNKPGWAEKIHRLRVETLGESQQSFAKRFGVTAMAISRWERGEKPPSTANLIELGKLAGDPDGWILWREAGLGREDVIRMIPALAARIDRSRRPEVFEIESTLGAPRKGGRKVKKLDVAAIPLLHDAAAAGEPRIIDEAEVDEEVFVAARKCPHIDETVAIRVQGDSMSPILEDGYIVAIDTHPVDRCELYNEMVAARDPSGAVTIKWLRKVGEEEMLIAQHTSTRFQPILLRQDPRWKIVGKVIWWFGEPK